ncbi:hypothetical protein EJB05_17964, partial [Eragrostis curvula]
MEEADNFGHGSDDTANPGQLNTMASGPSGTKPTEEEARIINKAIDIAVEELLIECANKIIAEEADFSGEGMAVFAGVEHAPPPMSEVCSDLNGDGGGGHGAGGGRAKLQPPPAVRTAPLPTDHAIGSAVGIAVQADDVMEKEMAPLAVTVADTGVLAHVEAPAGMGDEVVVAESEVGLAAITCASPTKSAETTGESFSLGGLGSRSSYSDVVRGSPTPINGENLLQVGALDGTGSQLPGGMTRSTPPIPVSSPPPSGGVPMRGAVGVEASTRPQKKEEKKLRRSTRSSVTDEHTLAKTGRMAARRNLETTGNKSFTSFSISQSL